MDTYYVPAYIKKKLQNISYADTHFSFTIGHFMKNCKQQKNKQKKLYNIEYVPPHKINVAFNLTWEF